MATLLQSIQTLTDNIRQMLPDGSRSTVRDTTERKKIERAIEQSEEKYRALTENISDAIALTDKNNRIVYRSPSLERLTGYTNEEAKSMGIFDYIHADALEMTTESLMKSINSPGVPVQFSTKIINKNGDALWIEGTSLNLLHDESIKGIVTNFRDVTERKQAEEKLRENEERYKSIIEVSNTGAWEYNLETGYLWCSPEYFTMLGLTSDDFSKVTIEDTWIALLHPDDREDATKRFSDYLKSGSLGTYESYYRMKHKNGNWLWFWARGKRLRDANNQLTNLTLGVIIDITERKLAEDEIRELNETLEQKVIDRTSQLLEANKALEAFSYSVTHDLKSPLKSVIRFTDIIQKEYASIFNDDLKELFGFISNSTKRMNAIIDDLLALAKYEKAKLQPAPVNMQDLVKRVWDDIQFSSPHHAKLKMDTLPEALADESLIEQVVVNLLSNAVKYSSKKDAPAVEVTFEKGDGVITYRVKDNGAGFDMKYYNRLFGAFQRLHGMNEFEGTGVGLLLVKRIIERHGGVVWAESKVNEGASFYFTLPSHN